MLSTVHWAFSLLLAASVVLARPAESSDSNKEMKEKRLKENRYHPDRITSHNKYELDFGADDRLVKTGTVGCFFGELQCSTFEKFCVGAYLNELNHDHHRTVAYLPVRCTHLKKMAYRVCGNFKSDADWLDNVYEPGLELYHNCSTDGRTLKSKKRLEDLQKTGVGFHQFQHDYELFNMGDPIYRSEYALRHHKLSIDSCPVTTISEGKLIKTDEEESDFYQNELTTFERFQLIMYHPHYDQY